MPSLAGGDPGQRPEAPRCRRLARRTARNPDCSKPRKATSEPSGENARLPSPNRAPVRGRASSTPVREVEQVERHPSCDRIPLPVYQAHAVGGWNRGAEAVVGVAVRRGQWPRLATDRRDGEQSAVRAAGRRGTPRNMISSPFVGSQTGTSPPVPCRGRADDRSHRSARPEAWGGRRSSTVRRWRRRPATSPTGREQQAGRSGRAGSSRPDWRPGC